MMGWDAALRHVDAINMAISEHTNQLEIQY